jgi:hypothetical protein
MIEIIYPHGETKTIQLNRPPTREEVLTYLETADLVQLAPLVGHKEKQMLVDEEGRLKGLLINAAATELYLHGVSFFDITPTHSIVGIAVLLTEEHRWT